MEPLYIIVTPSGYYEGSNVDRLYQLSFSEQVLACTESATSECSAMPRSIGALHGLLGESSWFVAHLLTPQTSRSTLLSLMLSFFLSLVRKTQLNQTVRLTQSILYIPFPVLIFQKSILLIVLHKYLKSYSGDLFSKIQQKSDPSHNIMRYFVYYSTQLASSFPIGRNLPGENGLYHSCTNFEGASWRGQPLNIFT